MIPVDSRRILLVDDMPSIHEDFRRILMPSRSASPALLPTEAALFGGAAIPPAAFELDCASSGEEALALLKTANIEGRPYALAFLDMRMPTGWDGLRTMQELWMEDRELQIVICTAYSDHPLEQAVAGLVDADRLLVLKKPFDPIEVSQMARAMVTKRRYALQSAAHLANLERVLNEVQEASSELRRRNRELETLATETSRLMRSPLRAVSMVANLLAQELGAKSGGKVFEYVNRLRADANSGEQLVDGLLSLTQIACSEVRAGPIDVTRIAAESMNELREVHAGRQVSIAIEEGLRAWGDEALVRIAVRQLLDNAWKFTSRQSSAAITVGSATDDEGDAVFFVRDSGCGFDIARAGNLFRKIQRLHPPEEYPGGGVGLLAVGRVISRHHGRVWIESRPNEGTTVFFTLPNPLQIMRS